MPQHKEPIAVSLIKRKRNFHLPPEALKDSTEVLASQRKLYEGEDSHSVDKGDITDNANLFREDQLDTTRGNGYN